MMEFVARVVEKNAALNDGTPRRERGFRPFVESRGPDKNIFGRPKKRYWRGPLFLSEADAGEWLPDNAAIETAMMGFE